VPDQVAQAHSQPASPHGHLQPELSGPSMPGPNLVLIIASIVLMTMTVLLSLAISIGQGDQPARSVGYATGSTLIPCLLGGTVALFSKPRRLSNAALATFAVTQLLVFFNQLASGAG
jgi:hypothetical protein